ncbi:MAG: carboxypeptidase-like regulatory domain-containing protein, partial [Planctomycetota bacterium]
ADAALRALPEADLGLVATADQNGNWELHHVPSRAAVQVSAVAKGFARQQRPNIELSLEQAVVVNFALHPGTAIRGEVVDGNGRPIAGASVEAWPSPATASGPFQGRSDDAGVFEVPGLGPGKYRVRIAARGYERFEEKDVAGDRADLRCVLHEQSRVRVRVQTPTGAVLRSYQLGLRRIFPEHGNQLAAVNEVPEQRVRLDGLTDACEVRAVPIGVLAVQIEADGWAKTLSEPFDNRREAGSPPGPREFDVVVTMRAGASLRGRVLGENGQGIAGATVVTQAADTIPDSPLMRLLAGAVPDKVTVTSAVTGADGSFVLSRLALADYQLMVEHPEACRQFVTGVRVERDGEMQLPPVRMRSGALISGRATVNGRVAGQVKIVLTTPPTVANARDAVRLETTTAADGAFAFARRVPPGDYELRAAVVGTSEPEAQIFQQLLQLQRSSQTVSVLPGQQKVEADINLPDH